jgi:hypothetical protein
MRTLGLAVDPTAGGSTYDDLSPDPVEFVDPTEFVPVTTAQVAKGLRTLDRNDEVRGVRGPAPISSFASEPQLTFETRCYAPIVKRMLRAGLGGAVTPTGVAPAAITSKFGPVSSGGVLPALMGTVIRDGQRDRLSGLAVNNTTLTFGVDTDGTISGELWGLYHEVDETDPGDLPAPTYAGSIDTFKLRDALLFGDDGTEQIVDLSGFSLAFANNLISDFESRFSAGENIRAITAGGTSSRLWYPKRNKLGPQAVTGTLNFGVLKPGQELLALISRSQKLVFEVAGGPAGTTPPAKETLRIVLHNAILTGGDGASPLVREGDIRSSYEFTAYVDPIVNKDIEIEYVAAAALV